LSLLTIIQSVCRRVGHPPPTSVIGNADETTQRLLEISEDEGRELARYGNWKVLRREHTFITTATESQTNTHTPPDMAAFIDRTIWNRTTKRRLIGPLSSEEYQNYKANVSFPMLDTFYLRGTTWLMNPVPTAGNTIAYEYRSSYWCKKASDSTLQETWLADTDLGVLPERLMELGIIWRYKQARGLDWATDYDKYGFQVQQALAADQPRGVVDMSGDGPNYPTGIYVPDYNWTL